MTRWVWAFRGIWAKVVMEGFLSAYDRMPYTSAEIPPAGAPSGFDSAAIVGFYARPCTGGAAPLRMTRRGGAQ